MDKGSILVIDDEYGVRSGIRQILQMEGYDTEEAADGRASLEWLERRPFDVVLIDYQLPDVDGLTLLGAIRERRADVMTCMITAYANIDTAIAATRQGIDFFLPKPFLPDDLVGVVDTLVRHRRVREDAARLRRAHEASLLALSSERSQTHTLVSCLRDAVLVVNREGCVVLANPAMAGLLSSTEGALLRRPAAEVLGAPELQPLREALLGGPSAGTFELQLGERAFVATVATFASEEGEAMGTILTLSDISEVRRMAMERARFVRTMVHELRSPLGAVRSLLEVATDRSLGGELESYVPFLSRAEHRIDKLVGLIGELLTLSRIELERKDCARGPAALGPVVKEVLELVAPRAQERAVRLEAGIPPDFGPVCIGEEDLRTILVNLVSNAVKYNRPGGEVRVAARMEAGAAVLEVTDTGIGVRAENLAHLFDEFFREKRPETRDIEGNGLGLAIVQRLAMRAGARLQVQSREGQGSTFRLAGLRAGGRDCAADAAGSPGQSALDSSRGESSAPESSASVNAGRWE
jgi:signal transduction histidine kinase